MAMYTPARHGAAQTAYHDQMATAAAGSLANASGYNFTDSAITAETGETGLEAGRAVVLRPVTAPRAGVNQYAASLPGADATASDIAGVAVRCSQMQSNALGNPCSFKGDMCTVARTGRSGARVWVLLADGAVPSPDGSVYIVPGGGDAGKFTSVSTGNLAVTSMIFRSAAENGIALVELL